LEDSRFIKGLGEGGLKVFLSSYREMHYGDGSITTLEIFMRDFLKKTGLTREYVEAELNNFYATDFDGIKTVVREQSKYLIDAVEELRKKGYNIVLATAPVFPEVAVLKRLSWTGISRDCFSYITTCENSNYYKYYPQYYLGITEVCGLDPKECLMVGNSVSEDLVALKAGMQCYYIKDFGIGEFKDGMCASGSDKDFYEYVKEMPFVK